MNTQAMRFLAGGLLAVIWSFSSKAEITLDGSLGPAGGAIPLGANNQFEIREEMGRTLGSNLFHSFGTFNIAAGETAAFTGTGAIENILSRVTGGTASNIDGTLRTEFANSTPNLFLLNPAGVVFGPNASLDVQGSFHVSTADYLRLGDGTRFTGIPSAADQILTTAAPEAFGFLGENPGSITFAGSGSELARTSLGLPGIQVPQGETISVVGGDIEIKGGEVSGEVVKPRLRAPSGHINIASLASTGEVDLTDPELAVSNPGSSGETQLGNVNISEGAIVEASGAMADGIYIRAGNFTLSGPGGAESTSLLATPDAGGKISLKATGTLTIEGGIVLSQMISSIDGGNVEIEARDLVMSNGAIIGVSSASGGNIDQTSAEPGKTGDITITASNSMTITSPEGDLETPGGKSLSTIASITSSDSSGGDIRISTPNLNVTRSSIGTSTLDRGSVGNIVIISDKVRIIGGNIQTTTAGSGSGGNLTLFADQLEIKEGGSIGGGATKTGPGGNTEIHARKILIDGFGQFLNSNRSVVSKITTSSISLGKDATIPGSADAGDITIVAERLEIRNGGQVIAITVGLGDGGSVKITASDVILSGESGEFETSSIGASSQGTLPGSGNAGRVVLNAANLQLVGGAQISVTTRGSGDGGKIGIKAENVSFEGTDSSGMVPSGVFVDSNGTSLDSGDGGVLDIAATNIQLLDGGTISGTTEGPGKGGDLRMRAETITLDGVTDSKTNTDDFEFSGSIITTASNSPTKREDRVDSANAGNIFITTGWLFLRDGQIQTSTYGVGTGGNLSIKAEDVILEGNEADFRSGLFANTFGREPESGDAGDLSLDATNITLRNRAIIAAETLGSGAGGDISINARNILLQDRSDISSVSGNDQTNAGVSGAINVTAQESLRIQGRSGITVETNQSNADNININAGTLIHLSDRSVVSTSVADGSGNGGNINIDPVFVVLDGGSITAEAVRGNGGNIDVVADFFFQSPDSIVDASSEAGIDGTVDIVSPDTNISGSIAVLPETYVNAADQLSERCGARTANRNSFVVKGRGSVPLAPGDFSPAGSLDGGGGGEVPENATEMAGIGTSNDKRLDEEIELTEKQEIGPFVTAQLFGCDPAQERK